MFGEHGPRQLASAALHVPDLDRAGNSTLMLDQEAHGIALGGGVEAPRRRHPELARGGTLTRAP